MNKDRSLYRIFDDPKVKSAAIPITGISNSEIYKSAIKFNEAGWGIFWTVNKFKNHTDRTISNIDKILSWAVDIDTGTKQSQSKKIATFPEPSMVMESKRGFHVYYNAIDASIENFKDIQTNYLVPSLDGDNNAKDLSRILRVPMFYHCKDINDKFLVKVVHESSCAYTEDQIKKYFGGHKNKLATIPLTQDVNKNYLKKSLKIQSDGGLIDRVWNMNCEDALLTLSGTNAVCGEVYSFYNVSRGNKNILVNGKNTSCFIDSDGRIGSMDNGGPTIWNWLYWFHKDHKKVYKIMREYFPEVTK